MPSSEQREAISYADLREGDEIEVLALDMQMGWEWCRRTVVAIDDGGPETTQGRVVRFRTPGGREYDIEAALDVKRHMRRTPEPLLWEGD